jgi:hypothetical protein
LEKVEEMLEDDPDYFVLIYHLDSQIHLSKIVKVLPS